jgi:hypothetical protein
MSALYSTSSLKSARVKRAGVVEQTPSSALGARDQVVSGFLLLVQDLASAAAHGKYTQTPGGAPKADAEIEKRQLVIKANVCSG